MSSTLLLLGDDLAYLSELSLALRGVAGSLRLCEASQPVRHALATGCDGATAAVVCLTGQENLGDVHALIAAAPATTLLFLTPQSPPRAALAHAVRTGGAAIACRGEATVVIAALVIGLLAASRRPA